MIIMKMVQQIVQLVLMMIGNGQYQMHKIVA